MSFRVILDVAPQFKLPRYKRISLKRNKVAVEDKEVDDALGRMLDGFAKFEDVEGRPAGADDLVVIDYKGTCEGGPVGALASDCAGLGDGEDFVALVGEPEFLPGITAGLKGMSIGDEKDIDVDFPDDFRVAAVAGKRAVYSVSLKGVREKVLPELDEEFLKRFEVGSETELRTKVESDLRKGAESQEEGRLKDEIAKFLLGKVDHLVGTQPGFQVIGKLIGALPVGRHDPGRPYLLQWI